MTRGQAEAMVLRRYRETFGEDPDPKAVAEAVDTLLRNGGFARMSGRAPDAVVGPILKLTNDILVCCSDASNAEALNAMTWAAVSLCRSCGVSLDDFIEGMRNYETALQAGGCTVALRRDS